MKGVWIAYHSDWSGFNVFEDEVEALRHAVEHGMQVVFVVWGEDPRPANRERR